MANFVSTSLDLIRRHKPRQHHLHSRWGDVGITPPVEGSWSQINNPYLRGEKKYGPGFVPALDVDDKEVLLVNHYDGDTSEHESFAEGEQEEEQEKREKTTDPKHLSKARRLTRILLPSSVNTSARKSAEKGKVGEFLYTPINANYAQEVEEHAMMQSRPGFRYVPASKHYLRELKMDIVGLSDDEDERYRHEDTDNDAEDEDEGERKGSLKQLKKQHRHQEQVRSHSCEPYISGGQPIAGAERRRKPRSRTTEIIKTATRNASQPAALPPGGLSRKLSSRVGSSSSASRQRKYEQSPSLSEAQDQSRGRLMHSRTKSPAALVQRSKSTTINKLHRRTMTLEMVGDQEDLW
ncbi:hypothetical protein UA08_08220 [Talaromyces atroroseus]|uniref:Uncharacterized protein n=1 Tax=Talaromyces atroroseus TaxID=1441469 RepID=A0A225A8Z6_TALAT|nr:hypothetical protein UA08_08220 [Talaromyces atroroseus]OKL56450.1 hypothetical protein UA08_08220 [Talaromyces atroroseus]